MDKAGNPLGCHYGSWNWTSQIDGGDPQRKQPPLLSVHGTEDTTVPIREAYQMQGRAAATGLGHAFVEIPGAGHVPQAQLINASTPYVATPSHASLPAENLSRGHGDDATPSVR